MDHTFTARRVSTLLFATVMSGLVACGGGDQPASDAAASADAPAATVAANAEGEAIYSRCLACHMANGEGMPGAFPPLNGSELVNANPDVMIGILIHGLTGPVVVRGQPYNGVMLPYGTTVPMTDAELAAVVTYVRQSWGNSASAVTVEDVARVRAATADRTGPYTAEELPAH